VELTFIYYNRIFPGLPRGEAGTAATLELEKGLAAVWLTDFLFML
jgi:hypothetical protein